PSVGNAQLGRSHFDAQDFMDTATPGDKSTHDGWLERVAVQVPGETLMQLVAFASRTPRAVLGSHPELVTQSLAGFDIVAGSGSADWSGEAEGLLRELHASADSPAASGGREVFDAIETIRSTPALAAAPANGAAYPDAPVGLGLRQAAQLVRAGLGTRCIYVNVPGAFDTHANQ